MEQGEPALLWRWLEKRSSFLQPQAVNQEAVQMVKELYPPDEHNVLVVAKEGWNVGVVGIVASRLVETFYRPTIVLGIDPEKGTAKGSARSIAGFDMSMVKPIFLIRLAK